MFNLKKISKTMITRQEVKELLPIMQAFAEGKVIETFDDVMGWVETDNLKFNLSPKFYRIKPERKYRPFKTQEECWNEMLKHQPFGWLKSIKKQEKVHIGRIFDTPDVVFITLSINEGLNYSSSYLFDNYTFDDGTPFGIKKEE